MHLSVSDAGQGRPDRRLRLKGVALLAAMSVLTLNLFTGSPLLALWLGSRVQGNGPPSMAAFLTFVASFGVTSYLLIKGVAAVTRSHNALTGRRPTVREHLPWLRSLRGERPAETGSQGAVTAFDVVLVLMVVAAVIAFEIWFFFYSGSPIDQRTGRV